MLRRDRSFAVLVALALAAATAASAQQVRSDSPTRLLDLEVRVTDLSTGRVTTYENGEHVQLAVGDRVRIELVGSALVGGAGRAVTLPADFAVGGGERRIDLVSASGTAVVHAVRPDEAGREGRPSHITFDVRPAVEPARFASGGVTFEIAPREEAEQPSERWRLSERLAGDLAHLLLIDDPEVDEDWIEVVYEDGEDGARALARRLATLASRDGRLREVPPWEVTAEVYRHLLGRQGTAADLWREDPGFRDSIELLEERGYTALVDAVLASEELEERYDLDRLDDLPRSGVAATRPR